MDEVERTHELLERIGNLLRNEARRDAAGRLQPVQLQALAYLARCNRFSDSPSALTEYLGLTKGTVSQTLNKLAREGLLERVSDPEDKRRVHLRLSEAGRQRVSESAPPPLFREGLAGWTPQRLSGLREELEHLLRDLSHTHAGRAFGVCRTCRHFQPRPAGAGFCGLLSLPLAPGDAELLCHEHEASAPG